MIRALGRLDRIATHLTPFVLSALLVMVSTVPVHLPGYGPVAPNIALVAVFYWTIYRRDLLPAAAVLALGLWQDILIGSPLGINAVTLLLVHGAIVLQRTFFRGKSFAVVWWAFGLTAALASAVFWLITMVYHLAVIDPAPLAVQFALTLATYPFLTWLFAKVHRAMLRHA